MSNFVKSNIKNKVYFYFNFHINLTPKTLIKLLGKLGNNYTLLKIMYQSYSPFRGLGGSY